MAFNHDNSTAMPALNDVDDQTADLILQLHLADLAELEERSSGKQREGVVSDAQIAARVFAEDVKSLKTILEDQRMSRSIARAVQHDAQAISQFVREEEVASQDRNIAHGVSGSRSGTRHESTNADDQGGLADGDLARLAAIYVSEDMGEEMMKKLAAGNEGGDNGDEDEVQAEGSAWASSRKTQNRSQLSYRCESCHEQQRFFDVVKAPCDHHYCRECIRTLFTATLTDESLFPPRCCRQAIPVESVAFFLDRELRENFEEKRVEYTTDDRTYCSRPTCSTFIKPAHIAGSVATCPDCHTETCTMCKGASHQGTECPNDTAMQAFNDLAQQEGWRRCNTCGRMVELTFGCYHMS
jgi:hypothetical protein